MITFSTWSPPLKYMRFPQLRSRRSQFSTLYCSSVLTTLVKWYKSSVSVRDRSFSSSTLSGNNSSPTRSPASVQRTVAPAKTPHLLLLRRKTLGIWKNASTDQLAKHTLRSATFVKENGDISEFTSFARLYRSATSNFALLPRIPRKLSSHTRITLSRASTAVSSFLFKMVYDCGYTLSRGVRLCLSPNEH
jgi:hypothetical protein